MVADITLMTRIAACQKRLKKILSRHGRTAAQEQTALREMQHDTTVKC